LAAGFFAGAFAGAAFAAGFAAAAFAAGFLAAAFFTGAAAFAGAAGFFAAAFAGALVALFAMRNPPLALPVTTDDPSRIVDVSIGMQQLRLGNTES
jgi:hypothetical protein